MEQNIQKLTGWGNYPWTESVVEMPREEADVKKALEKTPLIARGLGRSYGDQATNNGKYVAVCTRMNRFLGWDEKEGILELEAGVSL